jgi:hypothetical protein
VQNVTDKMLTLDSPSGPIKVQLTDKTALFKPTPTSLTSLKVGDSVTALGKMDGESAMTANTLEAGASGDSGGNQAMASGNKVKSVVGEATGPSSTPTTITLQALKGTIEAIGNQEITLKTNDRSVKITTNESTRITVLQPFPKEDLKSGMLVLVTGSKGDDGTITASQVRIEEGKIVQQIQK